MLPSLIPPGHLQAYRRLKLPVGSAIILGGFAFLVKGVGFTDVRAPECPGCLDIPDLGQQPWGSPGCFQHLLQASAGLSHEGQLGCMAVWLRAGDAGPGSIN